MLAIFAGMMRSDPGQCHGSKQTNWGHMAESLGARQVELPALISLTFSLLFVSGPVCMCVHGAHSLRGCLDH